MAVEGGANYRAGLVRRSKTKKDIAALRRKQAKDPMAWSKEKDPAKGLDKVIKSAKKSGLSFDSYNSLIKNAYGQGSGTFESGEFKPGLEGLISPKADRIQVDLRRSRALEGLTNKSSEGMGVAEVWGRPGKADIMYKKGDTYFPAPEEESLTENLSMLASFIKDNPRLAAEYGALASLQPFGRILGTGGDMGRDFEEGKGGGLIRAGSAIAYGAENEMGKPASASDYFDAGSWLVPGVGFSKPAVLAGKAAKAIDKSVPRPVTAGILAGGVAGAELAQPEEAKAWSPRVLFKVAAKNKTVLTTPFPKLPQELRKSLNDAARKQNDSTRKRLSEKRGEPISKEDWFADGVGITGSDLWDEAVSFFKASEFTDEAGVFTPEGLSTAGKALTGRRSKSLQYSHIDALEDARVAETPYTVQGPGKGILTWPRVNRSMGRENMFTWLNMLEDVETKTQIINQLGKRFPK